MHVWRLVTNVDYGLVRPTERTGCYDKAASLKANLMGLYKAVLKVIRFEPTVRIEKTNPIIPPLSDGHQTADSAWCIAVITVCAIQAHMPDIHLIEPVLGEAVGNEYVVSAYCLVPYRCDAALKATSRLLMIGRYKNISMSLRRWRL